jgi:hypothetical protein
MSLCTLQIKTDQLSYLERYGQNGTLFLYDRNDDTLVTTYDTSKCNTFGDLLKILKNHNHPICNEDINEIRQQIYDHGAYMDYNIICDRQGIQYRPQTGALKPIYRSQLRILPPKTIF